MVRERKKRHAEQKAVAEMHHNADLIRKYMVDPYCECIVRPKDALTRDEIMKSANETVGGALDFERSIRDKEIELR